MNGKEVVKHLKHSELFSGIPVVMFSASNNEKEIKECYALGIGGYLVKPDSYSDLVNLMRNLVPHWMKVMGLNSNIT